MDAYAENLNNNGLENRWGLVDSARLYLLPTIKGRSECEGNGGEQENQQEGGFCPAASSAIQVDGQSGRNGHGDPSCAVLAHGRV
jgi:hypothetical protein